ncbi:MAG: hypothetical protein EXX96DRAFT_555322 [Benjaminiella poitrasii]|nr:MAG: hypothetical protein EXX96DRAFT_555322 [Benjaminiella poitrasii]
MTVDDTLFRIVEEIDIKNEEKIYLSSGIPLNNINPKKLYESLRKRHARQRQRLLKNQLDELQTYHKDFILKNKDDLFITPTMSACQEIQGPDFLLEHNNLITELFSSAHDNVATKHQVEENLNDLKIEERSKLYTEIIRKKYIQGFNDLNGFHLTQLRKLEDYEDQDLAAIPEEIKGPSQRLTSLPSSPLMNTIVKSPTPVHSKLELDPSTFKRKAEEEEKDIEEKKLKPSAKKKKKERRRRQQQQQAAMEAQKKKEDNQQNTKSTANKFNKSQFIPRKLLPSDNKLIPPVVTAASSTNDNSKPLFEKKSVATKQLKTSHRNSFKSSSLIDDGTISIRNKPNRVVIVNSKGITTAYGDPKDYDDAINGITRTDNPVHKRFMNGEQYLFYRTESGHVVTIGRVSKIQPLIHKFFLCT